MISSTKKTLILLAIAASLALVSGAAYSFIFFGMKGKTEEGGVLSEKIDEISGKESRIAASVTVLRKQNTNIDKISSYFFKENDVVAFTKKIEALGGQSGTVLTIESLEQGYGEKKAPFLNFRIKATGKFKDISRLLVLLENFPGKFEWKTVRLVRDMSTVTDPLLLAKGAKPTSTESLWTAEVFLSALNFTNQ